MNTKIKNGSIPVSAAILEAARITEDTPLDVSVNGEGKLIVQVSDTVDKVIGEYAGRVLSAEEFDASLERISAISSKAD